MWAFATRARNKSMTLVVVMYTLRTLVDDMSFLLTMPTLVLAGIALVPSMTDNATIGAAWSGPALLHVMAIFPAIVAIRDANTIAVIGR